MEYGFSLAQIFFRFESRYIPRGDNFEDIVRSKTIEKSIRQGIDKGMNIKEAEYKSRPAYLDEWRQDILERRFKEASKVAERTDK